MPWEKASMSSFAQFWTDPTNLLNQVFQGFLVRVVRRLDRGFLQQVAQIADFAIRMRQQMCYLAFERASVHNFAERGVGCQRRRNDYSER